MLICRDVDDALEYERASPAATEILTGSAQHKPPSSPDMSATASTPRLAVA